MAAIVYFMAAETRPAVAEEQAAHKQSLSVTDQPIQANVAVPLAALVKAQMTFKYVPPQIWAARLLWIPHSFLELFYLRRRWKSSCSGIYHFNTSPTTLQK